jgi:hypothetical protein
VDNNRGFKRHNSLTLVKRRLHFVANAKGRI